MFPKQRGPFRTLETHGDIKGIMGASYTGYLRNSPMKIPDYHSPKKGCKWVV